MAPQDYRDSVQLDVCCERTFDPSAWNGPIPPEITGKVRLYQGFRPERVLTAEWLIFDFEAGAECKTIAVSVAEADDLILTRAFADSQRLLLNWLDKEAVEQSQDAGRDAIERTADQSIIKRIDWSKIRGGIDLTIGLAVKRSVLQRVAPPDGFTAGDIARVRLQAHVVLFGENVEEWAPDWLIQEM